MQQFQQNQMQPNQNQMMHQQMGGNNMNPNQMQHIGGMGNFRQNAPAQMMQTSVNQGPQAQSQQMPINSNDPNMMPESENWNNYGGGNFYNQVPMPQQSK